MLAAEDILGPNLGSLKGKTVHRKAKPVEIKVQNIPLPIMEWYCKVMLAWMSWQPIRFDFWWACHDISDLGLVGWLETWKWTHWRHQWNRSNDCTCSGGSGSWRFWTMEVLDHGGANGWAIPAPRAVGHDGDLSQHCFKWRACAWDWVLHSNREGAGLIHLQHLTILRMPALLIVEMVSSSILWLNSFPPQGGMSTTLSPRMIVAGTTMEYGRHCCLEFGKYVQTHDEHDNSMNTHATTGVIALHPTGNAQGGYFFLSLTTGQCLNR